MAKFSVGGNESGALPEVCVCTLDALGDATILLPWLETLRTVARLTGLKYLKLNTKYIGTETWYLCSNMGIFRTSFSFSLGAFTGVYIAQNYTIPNLKTFITTGLIVAKQLETQYRKPSKGEDD
uniref:Uncharacterized protein n=2 Tax=Physcomitrium patens TaxID=3218 RepID=A0A2K1KIM7_PHYPA|nr:hypothetical protein PHYPA_007288 [Physcomitrium patens]